MERKIEAVIQGVESRDVNRKRDGVKITLYEITTNSGVLTASRRQVAEAAYGLIGKPAELTIDEVEKNGFTNYYLNKVEAPFNGAQTTTIGQQQAQQPQKTAFRPPAQPQQHVVETVIPPQTAIPQAQTGMNGAEKDTSIYRQVATKVAAWLVGPGGSADDFKQNVARLMNFYETGEWLADDFSTPDMSGGRQFIPEGVNTEQTVPFTGDDDIPFS